MRGCHQALPFGLQFFCGDERDAEFGERHAELRELALSGELSFLRPGIIPAPAGKHGILPRRTFGG